MERQKTFAKKQRFLYFYELIYFLLEKDKRAFTFCLIKP